MVIPEAIPSMLHRKQATIPLQDIPFTATYPIAWRHREEIAPPPCRAYTGLSPCPHAARRNQV
ncbi:hypothetical protein E2562_034135 [Oryza meyeriana var. granulata]|uniref:Uncharacterized protein n=1 Tax=Oryza meyeriana var. granulata TaxID=110450 RepID=A0A6G1E677_9ORYZ|nr:hypothetical protein E2562_034135 [Oryza meyeriana var. granulata]